MTFTLEENEALFIMQMLGELPSRTGAFVVLQKMDGQFKAQKDENQMELPLEDAVAAE